MVKISPPLFVTLKGAIYYLISSFLFLSSLLEMFVSDFGLARVKQQSACATTKQDFGPIAASAPSPYGSASVHS